MKSELIAFMKPVPLVKPSERKLLMSSSNLPDDFIERDLRNSQYIAKKAKDCFSKKFFEPLCQLLAALQISFGRLGFDQRDERTQPAQIPSAWPNRDAGRVGIPDKIKRRMWRLSWIGQNGMTIGTTQWMRWLLLSPLTITYSI
jgi:hypothetical protein